MSKLNLWIALAVLIGGLVAVPVFADSQARIVRLSSVEGDVQIDRNTGQGYEKAFLNLPISQGVTLHANKDARAEVEFEDGSTLRITPGTLIEFPTLSLRDSGGKVSSVELQEGTAYVNFAGAKDDEFTLTFGREKFTLTQATHLRVQMGDTSATLAVFKGDVQVAGPSGTVAVTRKQTVNFNLAEQDHYTLADNLEKDPYDSWDKQQEDYHQRYMASSNSYSNYSPYGYGVSDLNYYGSFTNVSGYGNMWQPYFVGAGWDPFMNGAWAFNPGYGYGWVSAYPWGWTPYHYGSWVFVPTRGWMWQPGGSWAGWNAIPRVVNAPSRFVPPVPPGSGRSTVVVNRGSFPTAPGLSSRQVIVRNDSAGLGIPRGSIRNMGRLSQQVKAQGSATATIHPLPVQTATPITQTTRTVTPSTRSATPRTSMPSRSTTRSAPHSSRTPKN